MADSTALFSLDRTLSDRLDTLSRETGQSPEDIVREALELVADRHRLARRRERFARAAGIWKDRDDLPDFERMRREFDRTLPAGEPS